MANQAAESMACDEPSSRGSGKSLLPWVEKYRPSKLEELIAHEEIINILNKLIESNNLPHLLFHGPPGTGKTSTILACARKMYGEHYSSMTLELNASDDRGIDVQFVPGNDQCGEFDSYGPWGHPAVEERDYGVAREQPPLVPDRC